MDRNKGRLISDSFNMLKSRYKKLEKKTRSLYKSIDKVYCPCLGVDVIFNSKGFYHLKYDGSLMIRTIKERVYKMRLFPLAVPVIIHAKQSNGYKEEYSEKLNKYIVYWSLSAHVGKKRILVNVILKRVGNGKIIFYSIMKKKQKNHR